MQECRSRCTSVGSNHLQAYVQRRETHILIIAYFLACCKQLTVVFINDKIEKLKNRLLHRKCGFLNRRDIWILILICMTVPVVVLSCQGNKETAAPDTPVHSIADFEQVLDLRRWAIAGIAELSREKVKNGSYALKVKFFQEEWPGIATSSLPENISHYRVLKFDVYSTSKSRLNLWVRIDDSTSISSTDFKNRYNLLTELHEGWNTIEIPLKDIKSSDGKREVDLLRIKKFAIFLGRPDRDVILYFDDIRLEK